MKINLGLIVVGLINIFYNFMLPSILMQLRFVLICFHFCFLISAGPIQPAVGIISLGFRVGLKVILVRIRKNHPVRVNFILERFIS